MMNKYCKRKEKKRNPHQRGLKIACINVRGIVNNVNKRVELNHWMNICIDVLCVQEQCAKNVKKKRKKKKKM